MLVEHDCSQYFVLNKQNPGKPNGQRKNMKTKLKTVGMTTAILAALMALMMAPSAVASCHRSGPGCYFTPGYFPCPAGHADEIGVAAHDDGLIEDTAWTGQVCEVTSSGEMFHLHHDTDGNHVNHLFTATV